MGHNNFQIIEDSKITIDGVEHKIKPCFSCGCNTVYVHIRGGKYQVTCWWDTSCHNRSGWHKSLLEAVNAWND